MGWNGTLQIEKRPLPHWLVFCILAIPFLWGTLFHLLGLPSLLKYTADLAWVALLAMMAMRKNIVVQRKVLPLFLLVLSFFLYCVVSYVLNFQSVIYFLWGARNNFRFYVFFFAVIYFLQEKDVKAIYKVMDVLFWVNVPITLFQYFVLGYAQDHLGGIFGVETGSNSSTIIFFSIVLSCSLLRYMGKKESFLLCASKCAVSMFIAALAELKFFFFFFLIILVLSAFLTAFSWRKVAIFALCAFLVVVASSLLVALFDFEGFLSLENAWELATQEHYSSDETVNRLSAIPTLSRKLVKELPEQLFGLGLGNCDTSSFAICNTPFYQTYGHLRYTFFSCAFLFLEVGYVGLVLYMAFFAICFIMIRKRVKLCLCNPLFGHVALILSVLALVMVFYNAALRADVAYMLYFFLALPFIDRDAELENV